MKTLSTKIPELVLFETRKFKDERGSFMELYNNNEYAPYLGGKKFVQDNFSISKFGTLRGLHYQTEQPQGKLVSVLKGAVLDVAVDIRKESPYYGQWESVLLTEDNNLQFYIPPGFAHGFLAVSEEVMFHYKCTDYYHKASEKSIRWNDPTININWELDKFIIPNPSLSDKDKNAPFLE
jgi:dTDP-4-dehydrorhamnose 3,5-epimerase